MLRWCAQAWRLRCEVRSDVIDFPYKPPNIKKPQMYSTSIIFCRTSRENTIFREAFRRLSWIQHIQSIFPSHFIKIETYLEIIMGLQSAQSLGYILEDMGFKSWEEQENYLFSRTSRSDKALSLQIPACPLAVKWPGFTVWPLTSILESSLKNSGAISPLNLSPPWHTGWLIYFTLQPTYVSIPQEVTYPLVL